MAKYSKSSRDKLYQADAELVFLFEQIVQGYDNTITEGHRDEETQTDYYNAGRSKTAWPNSKHNKFPSKAVDAVPYPLDWGLIRYLEETLKSGIINDVDKFKLAFREYAKLYHFGGYVKGRADALKIQIRWGGDWDSDQMFSDQSFHDLPHFELNK